MEVLSRSVRMIVEPRLRLIVRFTYYGFPSSLVSQARLDDMGDFCVERRISSEKVTSDPQGCIFSTRVRRNTLTMAA